MSQSGTEGTIADLTKLLLRTPRLGMRAVLDMGIRGATLFQLAALMIVLASIVAYGIGALAPAPEGAEGMIAPIGYILVAGGNLAVTSVVLYWGGRMIGGTGDFQDVLLAMSVHQGVTILFQVVFALASLVSPALGAVLLTVGVFYLIYLMAAYVAEVHGFESVWKATGLIIGMIFGLAFILLFLFTLFGQPV
ncbi:YIP1 family protein [Halocynthiibacter sp. C4]|uniref:YIP1 family protein n=1 Tax=Halocynthiibacter sp. C4 TaxID=2992758 RepID=UPI00237A4487|nr:YIP1 family protein [Halocynthiibacter sp. C4]MDE0589517.1 YIP1 family protein [Halocynthiibacter sp. C4]